MAYPIIYAAGPIMGLSYDESVNWRDDAAEWLEINAPDTLLLSPMRAKWLLRNVKEMVANPQIEEDGPLSAHTMFSRDVSDVRRSNVLLANLRGSRQASIGTCIEIGIAHELQTPIVAVMTSADVHWHMFVREAATVILPTLEDGLRWIVEVLFPRNHDGTR